MAYQQQLSMQYSQRPQQMAYNSTNPHNMQPYQAPGRPQYSHSPPSGPPPMRVYGNTIYNAQTNQPLYSWTLSKAPDSDLSESLLTLNHIPTGFIVGTIRRGGTISMANCWGTCCCGQSVKEDVATVGPQGAKTVIKDVGTIGSSTAWDPTWNGHGSASEWAFFEDTGFGPGMVLRDAVSNGKEVLRVTSDGDINFGEVGKELQEHMVGEIMLILALLRVDADQEKESWWWELICS